VHSNEQWHRGGWETSSGIQADCPDGAGATNFKNQAESFDVVTEKIMTHENLAIATNGLLYESSDGTGGIQFYSRFSVSAAGVDDARPQGQVIPHRAKT
jgi:hypothetical protein